MAEAEVPMTPSCPTCLGTQVCPISYTACPGTETCVFAEVMQSLNTGILILDLKNQNVFFRNRVAAVVLVQLGEPGFDELSAKLLQEGERFEDLKESEARDNQLAVGSRLIGYSFYRSGDFVWTFLRDITERLRLEGIAESVEWMNSLGYVFLAVRHELGNPVNSIKTAVSVLRRGLDRFPKERVEEYLEWIENEVGRVETLLWSLKNFSIFEEPMMQAVEMAPFFESFRRLALPDLQARGISFTMELAPRLPMASADPRALQQILINLLANATDALDGQSEPSIGIRVSRENEQISVAVEDNGPGVSEENLARLFTPFFTTKEKGSGLGLVIVKKMVVRMNGTIRAERVSSGGTRLIFTIETA